MICERCHTTEATVHISTILHINPAPQVDHFCPSCAEVVQEANPFLHPDLPPLPVVTAKPVLAVSKAAKAKLRTVADKLAELDPILRSFCERRGLSLQPASEFWPSRTMLAWDQIPGYLNLTPDGGTPGTRGTLEFLKLGFYPEMTWALRASIIPRALGGQHFGMLSREVFSGIPFSELAGVLEEKLERGFKILRELVTEAIIAKGQAP